jgi:hypothetical protein
MLWLAQGALAAPFVQQRLVEHFDFDERDEGNFERLPKAWYVVGRDALNSDPAFTRQPIHQQLTAMQGYPRHNIVRFDDSQQTSGRESLYMGLNAGNSGAFLEVGAVPAVPTSDYLVTVRVRTTTLDHARASFRAYFIDSKGRRIDPSVTASDAVNTQGRWQTLSVRLLGDYPQAAFVGVQLELLQPRRDPASPLGEHQIIYEDVEGGAWFDDVMIWQLPSVSLKTDSPVNIIRAPQPLTVTAEVRDLTGRSLFADVAMHDLDLNQVAHQRRPVGAGQPTQWRWQPSVERFGWYLLSLKVYEADEAKDFDHAAPIGAMMSAMLYLPDEAKIDASDAAKFKLIAEAINDEQLRLMPAMMRGADVGAIVLSAFDAQTTRMTMDGRQLLLDSVMQPLITDGREVSLSLSPLPLELARQLDIDHTSLMAMFTQPSAQWEPVIAPMLMRNGQRAGNWQLGTMDQPDAFFMPQLKEVVEQVKWHFENLAPTPHLVLPWSLDQSRRADVGGLADYLIDVPTSVRAEHIADHLSEWRDKPPVRYGLHLRVPPATELPQAARVRDLTLRMLYGWEAQARTLAISRPWTRSDERRTTLLPDPLLGAFSTVSHRLAGRRVVGRLNLGEGLACMILNGPAGGMLVAWNRHAAPQDAAIDMYLGPSPQVVDIWGNRQAVPMVDGQHRWPLDRMPRFFEGIDAQLAMFRAGFALDEPFIESLQRPHHRTITLTNPWSRTITGYMHVVGPEGWNVEPRRSFFSIAAGDTMKIPLRLTFPVSEVAGHKRLAAHFDFVADQQYDVMLTAPMQVGMREVQFDASAVVERTASGSVDLVVTGVITNRGGEPLSMYAFANVQGYARQERVIAELKPGQSMVRRFRFTGAGGLAAQRVIRVGLRESNGPAVLNKLLAVSDQ